MLDSCLAAWLAGWPVLRHRHALKFQFVVVVDNELCWFMMIIYDDSPISGHCWSSTSGCIAILISWRPFGISQIFLFTFPTKEAMKSVLPVVTQRWSWVIRWLDLWGDLTYRHWVVWPSKRVIEACFQCQGVQGAPKQNWPNHTKYPMVNKHNYGQSHFLMGG